MVVSSGSATLCITYTLLATSLLASSQVAYPGSIRSSFVQNNPYEEQVRQDYIRNSHPNVGPISPSFNRPISSSAGQIRPFSGRNRPLGISNRPSAGVDQIQPNVDQYRPYVDSNRPFIGQNRPIVDQNRPFGGQVLSPVGQALSPVGQNRPSVGQIYPGLSRYNPSTDQIHFSGPTTRPSVGQNRPLVGQSPLTFSQNRPGATSTDDDDSSEGYEWEQEEMFEGDIEEVSSLGDRNGVTEFDRLWPNAIVYYKFKGPAVIQKGVDTVKWAMKHIEARTCIRFQEQKTERDFISIQFHSKGCWSSVGRTGGQQILNLNKDGCLGSNGTAVHELLHALGFYHEQSRADRDQFITIVKDNIKKGKEGNFVQVHKSSAQGVPYDYDSVLHYSQNAFSIDGKKPTIVSKDQPKRKHFGNRRGLTEFDARKVNLLYSCPRTRRRFRG